MELTAENTAIVVDSTADFPDAAARFSNWRVVPLYVLFGDESFRDYVELPATDFYARLRTSTVMPTTSQPTPGDFAAVYDELAGFERDLLAPSVREVLRERGRARSSARLSRPGSGSASSTRRRRRSASRCSASALQRRLERGTTDEEIEELVETFKRDAGLVFTVDTLEFLARGGRIGRAQAWAGELLSIKPILTIEDGEIVPVKRVRGNKKAFAEFRKTFEERHGGSAVAQGGDRARRRA